MENYSLIDFIEKHSIETPEKIAFTFLESGEVESVNISYFDLFAKLKNIAAGLQTEFRPGERVLLFLPNDQSFVFGFLGSIMAGLVPVPAYAPHKNRNRDRILNLINDSGSKIILADNRNVVNVTNNIEGLVNNKFRIFSVEDFQTNKTWRKISTSENDTFFIQYTSGSTSNPKGVVISHANMLCNLGMLQDAFNTNRNSVFASWLPLFHDMGLIGCLLHAFYVGCRLVLMTPAAFLQRPMRWLNATSKYGVTFTGAPNFAYDLVCNKIDVLPDDFNLSSLTALFNGAEPVSSKTMERFTAQFSKNGFSPKVWFPCYGLAEGTLIVSGGPIGSGYKELKYQHGGTNRSLVSSGVVCEHVDVLVVNEKLQPQSEEQEGEIAISGLSISSRYFGDKEENHKSWVKLNNKIYFKTGDLGFLKDNHLFISGRKKDVIILHGRNIYPQDIEWAITQEFTEFSNNVCAFSVVDDDGNESLAVAIELPRTMLRSDLNTIASNVKLTVFSEIEVNPEKIVFLKPGSLPKTSSGKLQRAKTKLLFKTGELETIETGHSPNAGSPPNLEPVSDLDKRLQEFKFFYDKKIDHVLWEERRTIPPHLILELSRIGFTGMLADQRYGGIGIKTSKFLDVICELSYVDSSVGIFIGLNNVLGILPLQRFGHETTKNKFLPHLAKGLALGSFAITEKTGGSNPKKMASTATTKDGRVLIDAEKIWIGNAGWAKICNIFVREIDSTGESIGISGFLVDLQTNGVSIGPEHLTMGVKTLTQNNVVLREVEVLEVSRLGARGQGFSVATNIMNTARFCLLAVAEGSARRCLDVVVDKSRDRKISTGEVLENEFLKAKISQIETVYKILSKYRTHFSRTIEDLTENDEIFFIAKILGPEFLWEAIDSAMQIVGGRAYIEDNVIPKIFRDARLLRIFEGPTETMAYHLGGLVLSNDDKAETLKRVIDNKRLNSLKGGECQHVGRVYVGRLYALLKAQELMVDAPDVSNYIDLKIDTVAREFDYFLKSSELTQNCDGRASPEAVKNKKPHQEVASTANASGVRPVTRPTDGLTRDREELLSVLVREVKRLTKGPAQNIKGDTELSSLGLDSLNMFELAVGLEEKLDVSIPDTFVWDYPTVNEAIEFLLKAQKTANR